MSRLLLLRHAKSSWDDPDLDDHDRPLAARGLKAATRMAAWIAQLRERPGLIICSSARRAVQTMEPVAEALGGEVRISVEEALYTFDSNELLPRIRAIPAGEEAVLFVGHNPAMQDLTVRLASGGSHLEMVREKFPTGGLATLELERAWKDVEDRSATLIDFVTPRGMT